jgi:hypothetical protein
MALFAGRTRPDLLRWLKRGDVRLLLPTDPGPGQMLKYARLFDPRAKSAAHGSINVDNMRQIYLSRGYPVDTNIAAAADIPDGLGVAFFVTKTNRAEPFSGSDVQHEDKERADGSFRLVRGLAIRLGGLAHPHDQPAVTAPLRATVYTPRHDVTPDQVHATVARYAPDIHRYDDVTLGSLDVSTWRTGDNQAQVEFWPIGSTSMMPARVPPAIGEWYNRRSDLGAILLQLSTPGNRTDPSTARLLGECALEVAAATGGVCTDQLGFRVIRPDDLVFG